MTTRRDMQLYAKRDENKDAAQELRTREAAYEKVLRDKAAKIAELEAKLKNAPDTGGSYKIPEVLHDELGDRTAKALEDSINGFMSDRIKTLKTNVETVGQSIVDSQKSEINSSLQSIRDTKQGRMLSAVSDMLQVDIMSLDRDPDFIAFMKGTVDPYSGRRNSELYQSAYLSGDARRMAELAKVFLDQGTKQRRNFSEKVMPDSVNMGDIRTNSQGEQGKQWTREDIKNFYQMVGRGVYTPEKIALIKQDIARAVREHKVI